MAAPYDSAPDTRAHVDLVRRFLDDVRGELWHRATEHDASKFEEPEKSGFDIIRPRLNHDEIDSDEYRATLREFDAILRHHYDHNRHHPEHFSDGIAGMNLIDLVEMVCDWKAASLRKPGGTVNLDWAVKRFGISDQLAAVIANTIRDMGW